MFELFTEVMGWLQIVASPLLIGLAIGAVIYFSDPTSIRLVIGVVITTIGLVIGIIWANKQWKGKGTIWFMSRIMATPELDDLEKEEKTEKATDDNSKGNR